MATVNSVMSGIATFFADAWNVIYNAACTLAEKVNTVVLPWFKDVGTTAFNAVKSLGQRDFTLLGIGAGVAATVTAVACAILCKKDESTAPAATQPTV